MTEQSDAEVALDWARDMGDPNLNLNIPEEDKRQFRALASALEAADQRAEEAEAAEKRWEDRAYIYATERDQLAAVVEKVRSVIERESGWFRYRAEPVSTVLASAPADALREHDAKVRAEALREAQALISADGYFCPSLDDRIEREAGLK